MRTSLVEIAQIQKYIQQTGDPCEQVLIEARLQIDPVLAEKVRGQRLAYSTIQAYGRSKIKAEIRRIDAEIFRHERHRSFRQKIRSIFSHS